jgi:hypothetical protein
MQLLTYLQMASTAASCVGSTGPLLLKSKRSLHKAKHTASKRSTHTGYETRNCDQAKDVAKAPHMKPGDLAMCRTHQWR